MATMAAAGEAGEAGEATDETYKKKKQASHLQPGDLCELEIISFPLP